MGGTRFMVQWEEHPSHLATRLGQLLEHQTLVDVTLMCNTHTLRVHRAVLAACSPYFETILQRQLGMHPLIVLKDMQFSVLKSLIEFMYCGETSVTEDNLGALLQAAKFFQVKGLSAMTKEALGLVPNPKSAVNGDAARKAFVGRPKRVGMQQTYVTASGMKTLATSHSTSSHAMAPGGDAIQTGPPKAGFQTVTKPVAASRPDTQQQTESAQLLLSLSGSEFPKQTFHTVSKNVRFHHNVSGSTVAMEPGTRAGAIEPNGAAVKKDAVERVVTTQPGVATKPTSVLPHQVTVGDVPQAAPVDNVREDSAPQSMFLAETHRKRGRPVKRQVNVVFQEKVLTDADMALHKEAEASRKALEMLRQEMLTDPLDTNSAANSAAISASVPGTTLASAPVTSSNASQVSSSSSDNLRKIPMKQGVAGALKVQTPLASIQTPTVTTTSRTFTQAQQSVGNPLATRKVDVKTNIVYKTIGNVVADANKKKTPEQQVAEVAATTDDSSSNDAAITFKEESMELADDMTEQIYHLAEGSTIESIKEENVEYQAAEDADQEVDLSSSNANIVYQVADTTGNGASAGSVMSQYMEVLKEAGLPTDVPILLDSGDGSYVTVNEEVLMNIVNGGVLQCHVTEGNIVTGEGVEFIVQELAEDEVVNARAVAMGVKEETTPMEGAEMETEDVAHQVCDDAGPSEMEPGTFESVAEGEQVTTKYIGLPSLDDDGQDLPAEDKLQEDSILPKQAEKGGDIEAEGEGYYAAAEEESMDITEASANGTTALGHVKVEAAEQEDEIISGDCYREPAMDGFAVIKNEPVHVKEEVDAIAYSTSQCTVGDGSFLFHEESSSSEVKDTKKESISGLVRSVGDSEQRDDVPEVPGDIKVEMSVEQALQEMMGEASDTEMDVGKKVTSYPDNPSQVGGIDALERSPEQEAEELRLVLSPEEECVKDNRIEAVFPPAVNSPDSTENGPESTTSEPMQNMTLQVKEDIIAKEEGSASVCLIAERNEEEEKKGIEVDAEGTIDEHDIKAALESCTGPPPPPPPPVSCFGGSGVKEGTELFDDSVSGDVPAGVPHLDAVTLSLSENEDEVSTNVKDLLHSAGTIDDDSTGSDEAIAGEDTVVSPSKDIPFAVGLLPLRTALEKLQAMPEYQPRKTRSSSTGKESGADLPAVAAVAAVAARVKRKASSVDGPDRKKTCSTVEGGGGGGVSELRTEDTTPASSAECNQWSVFEAAPVDEVKEGGEAVHSMPELLPEPTEG